MSSIPQTGAPRPNWDELRAIVTEGEVRTDQPEDAIDGLAPLKVIEPANEQELARALAWANANGIAVSPRGGGTKLGWGTPPAALDAIISTKRLGRVLEHAWADMTATVEAGCTISELQTTLAQHGQRLAIDPLFPDRATIGGLIATNDSGSLRLRYGGIRDLIIGATVALPDGTLARSGGKVVKNVAGYDLQKLMTGALGTLGIITQATFRLHPLPRESQTLSVESPDTGAANRLILAILDSTLVPTGLQLRVESASRPAIDIRLDGTGSGIEAQRNLLGRISAELTFSESGEQVWQAREKLFAANSQSLVCKFSVLPSQLAPTLKAIEKLCSAPQLSWNVVAQGTGLGTVRIDAPQTPQLQFVLNGVRSAISELGGTVVILSCPAEIKKQISVWGPSRDAQRLILRVKQQFDPNGTLNRGRFVGGI